MKLTCNTTWSKTCNLTCNTNKIAYIEAIICQYMSIQKWKQERENEFIIIIENKTHQI